MGYLRGRDLGMRKKRAGEWTLTQQWESRGMEVIAGPAWNETDGKGPGVVTRLVSDGERKEGRKGK